MIVQIICWFSFFLMRHSHWLLSAFFSKISIWQMASVVNKFVSEAFWSLTLLKLHLARDFWFQVQHGVSPQSCLYIYDTLTTHNWEVKIKILIIMNHYSWYLKHSQLRGDNQNTHNWEVLQSSPAPLLAEDVAVLMETIQDLEVTLEKWKNGDKG